MRFSPTPVICGHATTYGMLVQYAQHFQHAVNLEKKHTISCQPQNKNFHAGGMEGQNTGWLIFKTELPRYTITF